MENNDKPILLFDWDGTVVNSNDYKLDEAWRLTFQGEPEREQKIIEILNRPIGRQLYRYALIAMVIFETDPEQKDLEGVGNNDEWIREDERITKYSNRFAELLKDHTKIPPFEDSKKVLEELKNRGYKMYVVSGAGKEDIMQQANMHGLTEYFKEIYANDDSKPGHFEAIKILEGIDDPEKYIVIGDGPVDLTFAETIKSRFIGLPNRFNSWSKEGSDFEVIDNLSELLALLD